MKLGLYRGLLRFLQARRLGYFTATMITIVNNFRIKYLNNPTNSYESLIRSRIVYMMSIFKAFNIGRCDLPTMFSSVATLLRWVTLSISHGSKRPNVFMYVFTYSSIVIYIYVYLFSMLWFVFVRCRETGDLVAAFVVFSLATNSITCATKFAFMKIYKNTICELVSRYLECDAQVVVGSRLHTNILKQLKIVKQRAVAIFVSLTGITVAYILRAAIRPGRHLPEDLCIVYGLEPKFETPNYEISYFLTALCTWAGVYEISCVKALVVILVGYIEAQLLVLSEECSCLWNDAKEFYEKSRLDNESNITKHEKEVVNEQINIKLKDILRYHVNSIKLVRDLDIFYRSISVADFALIIFAIIAELLGKLENTFLEMPYTFLQIYVDCYIGQKLIDASEIFENSVYDCKWENFNAENMKIVYLLLQNSQKIRTITAGGLSPMNYVSLMSIIKTTYSAYTTLQSTVS